MSKLPSMAACMRRLSRDLEKTFNKTVSPGDDPNRPILGPTWLAWDKNGDGQMIMPGNYSHNSEDRDQIASALRGFFREHNIARYAFVGDIWIGTSSAKVRPSEDPGRTEAVQIMVEDLSGERLVGMRKIVRPKGQKPYLEKLEVFDTDMVGRFCGLLLPDFAVMTGSELIAAMNARLTHKFIAAINARRAHKKFYEEQALLSEIWRRLRQGEPSLRESSELRDDQGLAFIARTPEAPLVVVGRRDPRNGELCIAGVGPNLSAEKLAELCIAGVGPDLDPDDLAGAEDLFEMVTGQEAEALISLITTKLENGRRVGELGAVVLTGEQLAALHDANGTMN